MSLPWLSAEDIKAAITTEQAIHAIERVYAGPGLPLTPHRSQVAVPAGDLLLMPSADDDGVGVKIAGVAPGNPSRGLPLIHALYILLDAASLAPRALLEAGQLTAIRTAATSGVATKHLAPVDARTLVVFGAGVQARSHVDAMVAVRPVRRVVVVSKGRERAQDLVGYCRSRGLEAEIGSADAVSEADIVCTCTTSAVPVFDGALLKGPTHINAVGVYRPDRRELDDRTMASVRIVVETREGALLESGELSMAMASGALPEDVELTELASVVASAGVGGSGPAVDAELTLFKNVGVAFEDLAIAQAVVESHGERVDPHAPPGT